MAFTKQKIDKIEKHLKKQRKEEGKINLLELHRLADELEGKKTFEPIPEPVDEDLGSFLVGIHNRHHGNN